MIVLEAIHPPTHTTWWSVIQSRDQWAAENATKRSLSPNSHSISAAWWLSDSNVVFPQSKYMTAAIAASMAYRISDEQQPNDLAVRENEVASYSTHKMGAFNNTHNNANIAFGSVLILLKTLPIIYSKVKL